MLKNLFIAAKIAVVLMFFSFVVVRAQTDVDALLLVFGAPIETARYGTSVDVFGVRVGNLQTVEKRDAGDELIVSSIVRFPEGVVRSTVIVDKKTLRLKRAISEEFDKITEYEIGDGEIKGFEKRGKKTKNFSLAAAGDVYEMRAFAFVLFQLLPLDERYAGVVKIFDAGKKKIQNAKFRVADSETIAVGRERFDCYRIEVSAREDGGGEHTVWTDQKTRRIIRFEGSGGDFGAMFRGTMEILPPERKL